MKLVDSMRHISRSADDAVRKKHSLPHELRIVTCSNGFLVEIPGQSLVNTKRVCTTVDDLLDTISREFSKAEL